MREERLGYRILPIICLCYQCREVHRTLNYHGVNWCLQCFTAYVENLKEQAEGKLSSRYNK